MKKLRLIIPSKIDKYPTFLKVVCYWFFFFNIGEAKGQVYGCHVVVGMSDRFFYTPYGVGSPLEWQTVPFGLIKPTGEVGGYREDMSAGFGCIRDVGGTCTVYQQYEISPGPPQVIGMRFYRNGTYASLTPLNCPIDDWIPVFSLLMGGLGFIFLKRRWTT